MNFWTSIFAVFLADAVMAALGYNTFQTFVVLLTTTGFYIFVQFVIEVYKRWNTVD